MLPDSHRLELDNTQERSRVLVVFSFLYEREKTTR